MELLQSAFNIAHAEGSNLLQPLLIIAHIVGVALGAGGAAVTDATFLRTVWDGRLAATELRLIEVISRVVVTGLLVLIATGAILVYTHPGYFSLDAGNGLFLMKITIVTILTINGIVFHKRILPLLKRHEGQRLNSDEVRRNLPLLAVTGGISGISWYSALALGVLMQVVVWPYLLLLNIYLLLVLGAVLTGYVGLYWIVFVKNGGGDELKEVSEVDDEVKTGFVAQNVANESRFDRLAAVIGSRAVVGLIAAVLVIGFVVAIMMSLSGSPGEISFMSVLETTKFVRGGVV